ncbi:UNKNOWN [Stylonychia lemnae]|uniref:C3H1-type domain-containing protein n=1 Tax=Stylonychia lemnae TaxID=5949 RepID=A0A077ZUK7_STYLE|nr:UNKNOWN [Stylonychia lemnae]|eukprot:CDW73567.1 UNKNOWN [Stylonychia lemnae]
MKLKYQNRQPCKYFFDSQLSKCKFGDQCFYSHAVNPVNYVPKSNIDCLKTSESSKKRQVITKTIPNGYSRRNLPVCVDIDPFKLSNQCKNYSHCDKYVHNYNDILENTITPFNSLKIKMTNRDGIKLFNDLNWNITSEILSYFNYNEIMHKLRYINHETLYLTSERMEVVQVDKSISIKFFLNNFIPLMTHPFVKNAENINLIFFVDKDKYLYHFINSIVFKDYFISCKQFKIIFKQYTTDTMHLHKQVEDKVKKNIKVLNMILPCIIEYKRLRNIEGFEIESHSSLQFDLVKNTYFALRYFRNLKQLILPDITLFYPSFNKQAKYESLFDTKEDQVLQGQKCQIIIKSNPVLNYQQVQNLRTRFKFVYIKKISKFHDASRVYDIQFDDGMRGKKSANEQNSILLFTSPKCKLVNLTIVNFKNCQLIDDTIELLSTCENLKSVETLNLSKNQLTNKSIFHIMISKTLKSLQNLDIRKNKISSLNYFLFNKVYRLKSLKVYDEIEMSEDTMTQFFQSQFIRDIERLYIRYVGRRVLQIDSMQQNQQTSNLKYLYLQGVVFMGPTIPNLFQQFVNLEELRLQKCKIQGIRNAIAFRSLPKLQKLVIIDIVGVEEIERLINNCLYLKKLTIEILLDKQIQSDEKQIDFSRITNSSIESFKIRDWNYNEKEYQYSRINEANFFTNLVTLEIPCREYKEIKKILNVKNKIKKLILFNLNYLSFEVMKLMNNLAQNYKKLKKLDYLGIKAVGYKTHFPTQVRDDEGQVVSSYPNYFINGFRNHRYARQHPEQNATELQIAPLFNLKKLGLPYNDQIIRSLYSQINLYRDKKIQELIFYSNSDQIFMIYGDMYHPLKMFPFKNRVKLIKRHNEYQTHVKVNIEDVENFRGRGGRGRDRGGRGRDILGRRGMFEEERERGGRIIEEERERIMALITGREAETQDETEIQEIIQEEQLVPLVEENEWVQPTDQPEQIQANMIPTRPISEIDSYLATVTDETEQQEIMAFMAIEMSISSTWGNQSISNSVSDDKTEIQPLEMIQIQPYQNNHQ